MQQNNYLEAEDAYRRALSIAPDNNKMCNLGICLMKQGRITEAKETLRRVKPAVSDGPRGVDSHLKAYERAQQMLKDLESEMLNRGGDRVEQSRLFDAFLGSSSIWQPQPCRDHTVLPTSNASKNLDDFADENVDSNNTITNHMVPPLHQQKGVASKQVAAAPYANSILSTAANALISKNLLKDDFADENINITSNIIVNQQQAVLPPPQQRLVKPVVPFGNSWNVAAPPFYSSKFVKEPIGNQYNESLKRTRSGNATNSMRVDIGEPQNKPVVVAVVEPEKPETKTRRRLSLNKSTEFLPNDEDFEEAILAAVLGSTTCEAEKKKKKAETSSETSKVFQMKVDKRLKVFQDITLSLSPRA